MSSVDRDDLNKDWTVQSGVKMPSPYNETVLHTVTRDQLPDPDLQRSIGVDPDEWAAQGLVIAEEPAAEQPAAAETAKKGAKK